MKVGDLSSSETSQVFASSMDLLYTMLKFVKDRALAAEFNSTIISKIELASEEALVNIITHGYPDNPKGTIEIVCSKPLQKNGIQIVLIDYGIPFNPLEAIKNFKPGNIEDQDDKEETQVGGYGIYFIVNMMDSVHYKRIDEKNILTMIKYGL